MNRRTRHSQSRRSSGGKRRALSGLILGAAVVPVLVSPAGAAPPSPITYWTRCSLHVKVAGVEVSPVEVRQLLCAQASLAIRRASVL